MRNKKKKNINSWSYYAKILMVASLTFLVYGIVLNVASGRKLFDPVKDVEQEEKSTINISTIDNSEVVPGNQTTSTTNSEETIDNSAAQTPTETPSNNNNQSNNTSQNTNTNQNTNSNNTVQQPAQNNNVYVPTLEETNNNLRNTIQSTYGITIKYGNETSGYTVAGVSTTPVTNSTTINASLNRLNQALSVYPKGFFSEIRNGGIPLTIMLINNYAENSITGVTDSSYSYAVISIAVSYPFEESFYHESYHYIERYMFKKGANFNSWNTLNPQGFSYGNITNSNSYNVTFSQDAPFVNAYAQTSAEEDRASTFEYMMASSKASCLNYGTTVWRKATVMKNTIEAVYNTVSPNIIEYWERYL